MPCISACSVITTVGVLESDQWTIGYGEIAHDSELEGAYYGMLFKEKKKALNKEDK
jgi:hypothetical protein